MSPLFKKILFCISLLILSALVYALDYIIFRDARNLIFYTLMDIAFLFIQVLLVTIIIQELLEMREKQNRIEKLNPIIGVFFSELGTELLSYFSDLDRNLGAIRNDLLVSAQWSDEEFSHAMKRLGTYSYKVEPEKLDLEKLKLYLIEKRDFLLIMMENPNLMEHERFTELLRSVFHLTEELKLRKTIAELPCEDCDHIAADINRSYQMLVREWISYMQHLKDNFPYLFSLAMRTNPFDQKASVIVS
ncbi:MAG TPA: hypothetical protein VMU10_07195 [Desulfomonilia bacterium]|nr:hypothetical protein [Desulfomonilia bacterium]